MPPVRKQSLKRKNKQPERPFTPSAQQFEKAFNIISNIDNYNMPAFKKYDRDLIGSRITRYVERFLLGGFYNNNRKT